MKKIRGIYDERWWLDYLEGELVMGSNKSITEDMEALLKSSLNDRRTLKELERVRVLVKEADDVVLPEDLRVYDNLHDKIMMAVEETEVSGEGKDDLAYESQSFAAMWTALTRRWQEL